MTAPALVESFKAWRKRQRERTCENDYHRWRRRDYLPGWISYICTDCGKESW